MRCFDTIITYLLTGNLIVGNYCQLSLTKICLSRCQPWFIRCLVCLYLKGSNCRHRRNGRFWHQFMGNNVSQCLHQLLHSSCKDDTRSEHLGPHGYPSHSRGVMYELRAQYESSQWFYTSQGFLPSSSSPPGQCASYPKSKSFITLKLLENLNDFKQWNAWCHRTFLLEICRMSFGLLTKHIIYRLSLPITVIVIVCDSTVLSYFLMPLFKGWIISGS